MPSAQTTCPSPRDSFLYHIGGPRSSDRNFDTFSRLFTCPPVCTECPPVHMPTEYPPVQLSGCQHLLSTCQQTVHLSAVSVQLLTVSRLSTCPVGTQCLSAGCPPVPLSALTVQLSSLNSPKGSRHVKSTFRHVVSSTRERCPGNIHTADCYLLVSGFELINPSLITSDDVPCLFNPPAVTFL